MDHIKNAIDGYNREKELIVRELASLGINDSMKRLTMNARLREIDRMIYSLLKP
jgi:hypothetical protein